MPAELSENRTKNALDGAMRQLLERKPLDQIRVRELTELCEIRRQSFYYHFPDTYALFQWSLQQEQRRLLRRQEDFLTWQQALTDLLEHTAENRSYYQALLDNQGRSGLWKVLRPVLGELMKKTADYYRQHCGIDAGYPEMGNARWDCVEAIFLSMMEGWVLDELSQQPEEIVALVERNLRSTAIGEVWQDLIQ